MCDFRKILGIGTNGRIGFNEPEQVLRVKPHPVDFDSIYTEANARFFETIDQVPTPAISMGLQILWLPSQLVLYAYVGRCQAIAGTVAGAACYFMSRQPAYPGP